ncbi:MAG: chromosome segregation protein Spc25-domain-containing protein [Linnemannia elongata]|nr:MAG: chromosome segregation protein Spc25-domain-containing protein [Linnemannia elongata]
MAYSEVQAHPRSSLRSSTGTGSGTGGRPSLLMDHSNHRSSFGSQRLSLIPSKTPNLSTPTLPTPQFDSDELLARAATFETEVNSAIQKIKSKIVENTEQWVRETAEAREYDREVREEMKIAVAQETALTKTLQKEREEAQIMTKTIQQLSATYEDMKQTRALHETQLDLLRKEVKAKREAKIALKKALDEQVLKNKPELASYESFLSMRIVGVKVDHIGFIFTRISEQDWEKEYSITLDVSQHEFSASDCSPELPELPALLRYLNETRDFYGFMKKVRQAFRDLSKK